MAGHGDKEEQGARPAEDEPRPVAPRVAAPHRSAPSGDGGDADGALAGRLGEGFFAERPEEEGRGKVGEDEERSRLPLRERWSLALEDRLPLWLRLRCGIEPKTLIAVVLVLLVGIGFAVHHFWTGRPQGVAVPSTPRAAPGEGATRQPGPDGSAVPVPGGAPAPGGPSGPGVAGGASPGKRLVVDVSGKVREPGIHRLPAGSRVTDAIEAAGGLRKGADTEGLNQARLLVDGEQIVVGEPGKAGAAAAPAPGAAAGPAAGGAGGAPGTPISLSSATPEQLETLPGVGPVLAQHIVDYRTQHGGFTSVDQLKDVDGIGDKRFADIKPMVTP
ncbi:ComEA family DNA-binding protein [Streptomyces albus]|uniref:ComEA family DNA-binding protein n=1 Tax=Streptomyces albus TaxID=1888 RepID=UPI00055C1A17|nr:ComEA family DNA-binding protein [Streptomyces albus]KPC94152.1 comEA protein [Streptomyces sp. NRRL F-6602]